MAAEGGVAEQVVDARGAVGRIVGVGGGEGVVRVQAAVARGGAVDAGGADVDRQNDAGVAGGQRRVGAEGLSVADGARLLTLSSEKQLRLLDARTGAVLHTLPHKIEHAVFAGGPANIIGILSEHGDELVVIDSTTGQVLKSLPQHQRINAIAASQRATHS